jgi:D-alanyl-D-alanine carboxypeptidase
MRLRTGAVGITYLTTMLLQLADEGAVTLDDPIARWYPELPRAGDGAVIPEPVLHADTTERGPFEDSTYWNPSWTTASGAILTSDICDLEISARAVGTGRLLSERARREILDPGTVGLGGPTSTCPAPICVHHTAQRHYGLGVNVRDGWIEQTPSFAGYSAVQSYQPDRDIAIAVATTRGRTTTEVNSAATVAHRIAALLT